MPTYNWQQSDWPSFSFSLKNSNEYLLLFAEKTGHLSGVLKALPENMQIDALLEVMVAEALKTSEIEGEYVSRKDVMSSIKNKPGLNLKKEKVNDQKADGVGQLMFVVRQGYAEPLTNKMLFNWHTMLMKGNSELNAGCWRTHAEPMQVVSGAMGKQKIHFEGPPSANVPGEMKQFMQWFNDSAPGGKSELKLPPVRAALAHLYFESIHPFEDGNGRIGRAVAEKALSQGIGRPILLSLSQTIEASQKQYYTELQKAQRTNMVTQWVEYFLKTVVAAQTRAEEYIEFTLNKARYFDRYTGLLNERQHKVMSRLLEAGPNGFEGGLNAGKYVSIAKVSKATATRDLQYLLEKGAIKLAGVAGGRSTSYLVNV